MDSKASSLLFLAILCFLSSTSTAFNITRLLSNYTEFGAFNDMLSQTGLAQQINSRQTITVLVVDNSSIDGVSGKPLDVVKRILSAHVILDYYDETKLSNLKKKSSILTTLYQTTGVANDQQGFLNVTKTSEGIMFGSAVKGAPLTATLVKSVASQPYNISVLQVSGIIEPPGIENLTPPPPRSPGAPKKAPAPAPSAKTPATPVEAPAPVAEEPAADEAPIVAPTPADGPVSDAPVASAPETDSPPAADALPPASASSCTHAGGAILLAVLVASLMGF